MTDWEALAKDLYKTLLDVRDHVFDENDPNNENVDMDRSDVRNSINRFREETGIDADQIEKDYY